MTTSSVTGSGSNFYGSLLANSAVTASTSTAAVAAAGTGTAGSSQDLAQTFLTLLVAQMNNQDPLDPVDNNQLTTQMAQISTVSGINTLNSSVQGLLAQLQQSATIQSAQLTGHAAMVAGSQLALGNNASGSGESAVGGFNLSGAAQNVAVTVQNASGTTVATINLGAMSGGFQDFTWNGTLDAGGTASAGNYSFQVNATASSGAPVSATAYNAMTIVGTVPQSGGGLNLMLSNGTQVPYSSIQQII